MITQLHFLIGSDSATITWWQMCFRAALIFLYGLILVRLVGKRVFGKNTSFDIVLAVILGSILSRALTANARFIPTLCAAALMIVLHRLMATVSMYSTRFGHLIKGHEDQLIKNGKILEKQMKRNKITRHELIEAVRSRGRLDSFSEVKSAYIERNGDISVIPKSK